MSNKLKIIIGGLVALALIVVIAVVNLFISIFDFTDKNVLKETEIVVMETKEKYDFTMKYKDLKLGIINNYVNYLNELLKNLKPKELQNFVGDNNERAIRYKRQAYENQTGADILLVFKGEGYRETLNRVTTPNSDWTGLPLTENFRNKYNEKESVSLQKNINKYSKYSMNDFSLAERKFAMAYKIWTDGGEAHGWYNQQYNDWYNFILDDEGYLDDVIFDHTEEIPRASYDE